MENKTYVPENIPADLEKSWHIPRPTLARSSNSSQGSTSSNNSTQSVRSGSLLLTAATLAQIQQTQQQQEVHQDNDDNYNQRPRASSASRIRDQNIQYYLQTRASEGGDQYKIAMSTADLILPMNEAKKMEPDNMSIASSTHFTVVNVNTRVKPPERSFCRKNQLTILVLSMSALFTVGILTAILLLEMRAKNQRYH